MDKRIMEELAKNLVNEATIIKLNGTPTTYYNGINRWEFKIFDEIGEAYLNIYEKGNTIIGYEIVEKE